MDDAVQDIVLKWFIKADHDLRAAVIAVGDDPPITDVACYHAQQCVEKYLKAYHAYCGEHIEKTHSLTKLLQVCSKYDLEFLKLHDITQMLTDYAVSTRYPDDWYEIPLEEATKAIEMAEQVMIFVKDKLNIDNKS